MSLALKRLLSLLLSLSLLALRRALFPASFVAGLLFFTLPHLTQSSFDNMGYWVDWGNLFLYAAAFGAVAAALTWPLAAMMRRAG